MRRAPAALQGHHKMTSRPHGSARIVGCMRPLLAYPPRTRVIARRYVLAAALLVGSALAAHPASAQTFTITTSAGAGGQVVPGGVVTAEAGSSPTFAITPD